MLGHIVLTEQKGRKPLIELETTRGLVLLRAGVPVPPGAKERAVCHRVALAARLLRKAGVRRVLTPPEFPWWSILREWELVPVDTALLCQALAPKLALAYLARLGVSPERATLALRGGRVSRPFFQAAMALSPGVRALVIASPNGGEALSAYLRSEYGVPVLEEGPGLRTDLTLEFSILRGGEGEKLILHGQPDLKGISVLPEEGGWPAGFDVLPLAAALWEAGELSVSDILCT